jgi:hypothetical protein
VVRHWTGPVRTLANAWEAKRHLWALCLDCGHAAKLHPRDLIMRWGSAVQDIPLDELRDRGKLRCRRCSSREVALVPNYLPWPSMR